MNARIFTRTIAISAAHPEPDLIAGAAEILRAGGLVAFPTETVYGLGADATNPVAVGRIFEAKGRPSTNPLIVHADCLELAIACVAKDAWTEQARALAHAFWPGSLTIVLPKSELIPDIVTAGQPTVAVRVPRSSVALSLIRATGKPLAAPSANRSTGVSPTMAAHVLEDLDGAIELILDAGPTEVGLESTVVDLTTREPHILRPGPITASQIRHVLHGTRVHEADPSQARLELPAKSPGLSPLHYAPKSPMRLVTLDQLGAWCPAAGQRVGLLVCGHAAVPLEFEPEVAAFFSTPELAARNLYSTLHAWDRHAFDVILVVPPPRGEEWAAVRDRLTRAVGGG